MLCSCEQMNTAWVGEGLGWVIKHPVARQHSAHRDARDAQHFTFQSCVGADLYIDEIHLFTYS